MRRLFMLALALPVFQCPSHLSGQDDPSARLPMARPGSSYAAKLQVHDRFSLPLATCRLAGDAPAWLHLDCQRLMLTGRVPPARTGKKEFRLEIADSSGEKVSYALSLQISRAPEEVALGVSPPSDSAKPLHAGSQTDQQPEAADTTASTQTDIQATNQPKLVRMTPADFVPGATSETEPAAMLATAVRGIRTDRANSATAQASAADKPSTSAKPASAAASDDTTGDYDLGMVRYYFTGGELLSKQDSQFSHASLFLDLHLDRSLLLPGGYPGGKSKSGSHNFMPGLNSYFDVQLTSVPAAVQNCTPATATSSATTSSATPTSTCVTNSTSSGATGAVTTPKTTAATATDPYQVFLNSQKAATVGGAVYFPWMLPVFIVSKESYSTFLAPIAKIGFVTTTEGLNTTQQSSAASDSVAPIGNSASFYKNYSFGGRIGLYKLPKDAGPGHAPAIESYIDISLGKFSNLPTLVCDVSPSANPGCTSLSQHVYQQQYRFVMEGLLDIPKTKGLSLGFSANLAQREIGTHHYDVLPPDDMRILFGYRFDVTKFVKTAQSAFGDKDTSAKDSATKADSQ